MIHSARPSPMPAKMSSRPPDWSWRMALKPASRRAASTASAAAGTPASWLLKRSTSSVIRSMMPWAIRALPPARAKPYRAAARSAIRATSRWSCSIGIRRDASAGRRASGGGCGGGAEGRVLLLPGLADALGQVEVRPQGDQGLAVQVGEVAGAAGLAQHGLVDPRQHAGLVQVERAVGVPEQPDRQLYRAVHGSGEVGQAGRDEGRA